MFNFPKLCCPFYELPPPFLYRSHICPLVLPPRIVLEEGVTFRQGEKNTLTTNIETEANKSPASGRRRTRRRKAVKNHKDVHVSGVQTVPIDSLGLEMDSFLAKSNKVPVQDKQQACLVGDWSKYLLAETVKLEFDFKRCVSARNISQSSQSDPDVGYEPGSSPTPDILTLLLCLSDWGDWEGWEGW